MYIYNYSIYKKSVGRYLFYVIDTLFITDEKIEKNNLKEKQYSTLIFSKNLKVDKILLST